MATLTDDLLTDDMLARFDERAPMYDRENRFFDEDFDELRRSGYLLCTVPTDLGGAGLGLDEYVAARASARLRRTGDGPGHEHALLLDGCRRPTCCGPATSRCRFILERAAEGKVFCALHGEAGNDLPLLLAVAGAERADGGWEISGHKIFGSLSPVWDYGGFHAMDVSDPEHPMIVHGFLPRTAVGLPDHRHLGHARDAGDPEPGHRARQGVRAR